MILDILDKLTQMMEDVTREIDVLFIDKVPDEVVAPRKKCENTT